LIPKPSDPDNSGNSEVAILWKGDLGTWAVCLHGYVILLTIESIQVYTVFLSAFTNVFINSIQHIFNSFYIFISTFSTTVAEVCDIPLNLNRCFGTNTTDLCVSESMYCVYIELRQLPRSAAHCLLKLQSAGDLVVVVAAYGRT